jgi:hypothetical protein
MTAVVRLLAGLGLVALGGVAARRLLAASNTQVHRINQDKPLVTERGSHP